MLHAQCTLGVRYRKSAMYGRRLGQACLPALTSAALRLPLCVSACTEMFLVSNVLDISTCWRTLVHVKMKSHAGWSKSTTMVCVGVDFYKVRGYAHSAELNPLTDTLSHGPERTWQCLYLFAIKMEKIQVRLDYRGSIK